MQGVAGSNMYEWNKMSYNKRLCNIRTKLNRDKRQITYKVVEQYCAFVRFFS